MNPEGSPRDEHRARGLESIKPGADNEGSFLDPALVLLCFMLFALCPPLRSSLTLSPRVLFPISAIDQVSTLLQTKQ
jgi:hypothetical protein